MKVQKVYLLGIPVHVHRAVKLYTPDVEYYEWALVSASTSQEAGGLVT